MPPKSKPLAELGGAEEVTDGTFRAHVKYRDATGGQINVRGPKRQFRRHAEADLDQIRAADLS